MTHVELAPNHAEIQKAVESIQKPPQMKATAPVKSKDPVDLLNAFFDKCGKLPGGVWACYVCLGKVESVSGAVTPSGIRICARCVGRHILPTLEAEA